MRIKLCALYSRISAGMMTMTVKEQFAYAALR